MKPEPKTFIEINTDYEKAFIDSVGRTKENYKRGIAQMRRCKVLTGYLKGLSLRSPRKTAFDIKEVMRYAKNELALVRRDLNKVRKKPRNHKATL